jgi:hypothetical protein
LRDERIKYIVKAKGEDESLAKLVETAIQEESEIISQRSKGNHNWVSTGYSRSIKTEPRPQVKKEVFTASSKDYNSFEAGKGVNNYNKRPTCNICNKTGHIVRNCRKEQQQGNR